LKQVERLMSEEHDLVFETLERMSSDIFINRDVLRPDYVPEVLPHREGEIRRLTEVLAPILRRERPSNIFIYGLTGTGKTAVVRYVLRRFEDYARKKELNHIAVAYLNCRHEDTTYRVLTELARSLGERLPFTGLSTAEVFKRFKEALDSSGKSLIAVLDEIEDSFHGLLTDVDAKSVREEHATEKYGK
jgi:cell division control protein 6